MAVVIVVGAQWGDEGKGKSSTCLTERADMVVRWAGGANAGHTLVVDGKKHVTRLIPSGVLRAGVTCVLGEGMVIDPAVLVEEIRAFRGAGLPRQRAEPGRRRARAPDPAVPPRDRSPARGAPRQAPSAPPRKGIGPTYESKAARIGVRVGDLLRPERFREQLARQIEALAPLLTALGGAAPDAAEIADALPRAGARSCGPTSATPRASCTTRSSRGDNVLFEGAQGVLLDLDHGTYPFVTSSSTTAGGACAGLGIGPTKIDAVSGDRQGLRDARRRRAVPDRAHRRDRRPPAQARQRVRLRHRPAAPLRLARPAGAAAGGAHLGHRGAGADQARRAGGPRTGADLRRLPAGRARRSTRCRSTSTIWQRPSPIYEDLDGWPAAASSDMPPVRDQGGDRGSWPAWATLLGPAGLGDLLGGGPLRDDPDLDPFAPDAMV